MGDAGSKPAINMSSYIFLLYFERGQKTMEENKKDYGTGLCYGPLMVGVKHDLMLVTDGIIEGIKSDTLTATEIGKLVNYYAALQTLKVDMEHTDRMSQGIPKLLQAVGVLQKKE